MHVSISSCIMKALFNDVLYEEFKLLDYDKRILRVIAEGYKIDAKVRWYSGK